MTIAKFLLYWRTLRHLSPVQFYGRVWFRLYRPQLTALLPEYSLRVITGTWQLPTTRTPLMLKPWQFRFLNYSHTLPAQGGWNDVSLEKLWLYNLHYFDDLNARESCKRVKWHQALVVRWIRENPPASGNGWDPYPTSLRIVNWIKWLAAGNTPVSGMLESLVTQASWLDRRKEWHLQGNHLFSNAKTLVFAGLFFEGPQAAKWLKTGLKIIDNELPKQVLPDGGNFERSTMYHAIFLEDVLDLINASTYWSGHVSETQVLQWREVAGRLLGWLTDMTHPDGEIAFFNDAAFCIAPKVSELRAYAQRLRFANDYPDKESLNLLRFTHFCESGYIRMEADNAVSFLDVAPIGPDYLPAHAHADTLSFELSLFSQRVVVNGGTSCYGTGPVRLRERGTSSHSTVQVTGQNSSEVWDGFRVARRAYPLNLQILNQLNKLQVACSHDGYMRLSGEPMHRREWVMNSGSLMVTDQVMGGEHCAVARYILHPNVKVIEIGANEWLLELPRGEIIKIKVLVGRTKLEDAKYAPEFGKVLSTKSITVDLIKGLARTELCWS